MTRKHGETDGTKQEDRYQRGTTSARKLANVVEYGFVKQRQKTSCDSSIITTLNRPADPASMLTIPTRASG